MEFAPVSTRVIVILLLLALHSPCKFFQSSVDFGPLKLLQNVNTASVDFGRIVFNSPSAVLRPQSAKDISLLLDFLSTSSPLGKATVVARGAGHSIHGQAQALDGIVVEMDALPANIEIFKNEEVSYADVSGGTLWIELLRESLRLGLAPRSWTDYLYLSVGGTLSNAGISGQAFKYGPQISNVLQLEVVTGTGAHIVCSPSLNSELFYSVLGGLGQFGIITRASIILQEAPKKVRWIRAFYHDFNTFTEDQEQLVSMPDLVDYVEGFIVPNEGSLVGSYAGFPANLDFNLEFGGRLRQVYYCLEFAIHDVTVDRLAAVTKRLRHMPALIHNVEVSYLDFLDRVRGEEMNLRQKGLWDVPHPWLNMFVPKRSIAQFKDRLLETIAADDFEGPLLIYPLLRDKWESNSSAVIPAADGSLEIDNVFYVVGVLRSANPATCSAECLSKILLQNQQTVQVATTIGAKQYLPFYSTNEEWERHFGEKWQQFSARKSQFDPSHVLAPGLRIFPRTLSSSL
ncbi:cytokinin dehydrogenase 3-like [Wolffia australiana]